MYKLDFLCFLEGEKKIKGRTSKIDTNRGACLARSVEHGTLDLGVRSWSPTLGG